MSVGNYYLMFSYKLIVASPRVEISNISLEIELEDGTTRFYRNVGIIHSRGAISQKNADLRSTVDELRLIHAVPTKP